MKPQENQDLCAPTLKWIHDGRTPYSAQYGDLYFDEKAVEETEYVFLQGNKVVARLQGVSHFTIGETGFGTGLNFACVLKLASRFPDVHFRYYSCEKHPLSRGQHERLLATRNFENLPFDCFVTELPLGFPGNHRVHIGKNVELNLFYGDVRDWLNEMTFKADAWFLDGFAPSKNPEMWNSSVFAGLARNSKKGTTFATFTSAGQVRRDLTDAGFEVRKTKGFAGKREMLVGKWSRESPSFLTQIKSPWYYNSTLSRETPSHAYVIGGGLAGCSVANRLAERGLQVTVLDEVGEVASSSSASSAPASIYMPHVGNMGDPIFRLSSGGFNLLVAKLRRLRRKGLLSETGFGATQVLHDERRQKFHASLEDENSFGIGKNKNGLEIRDAGWIVPRRLCQAYVEEFPDRIRIEKKKVSKEGLKTLTRDAPVVICNSLAARTFLTGISLQALRGQCVSVSRDRFPERAGVVAYGGYQIHKGAGEFVLGSSFVRGDESREPRPGETEEILRQNREVLGERVENNVTNTFVGIRSTTPDSMPIIGRVPDDSYFKRVYSDLRQGRSAHKYPLAKYEKNLFILSGLGAKGLIYSALGAEVISSMVIGEDLPIQQSLMEQLHPARFFIRSSRTGHTED